MLRCGDGSLYTGIAVDVAKRIAEHSNGVRGAKYLRGRGPLKLVLDRGVPTRGLAQRVEHKIKQLRRWEKEALVGDPQVFEEIVRECG